MELKVNNCRYGNYIIYGGSITQLNEKEMCHFFRFSEAYKPITLTEEWLLKFGFGKSDEHELGHNLNNNFGFYYDYHFKRFRLETSDNDGLNYADVLLNIKHVHQLQNLFFALTGEELKLIH